MKKLLYAKQSTDSHWVGDGFPVRQIFSYSDLAKDISPFLLMDYAGPANFPPSEHRRGVGEHPHRGFETVTMAYEGEVEHRDSAGGGGLIRSGDVQWMTAASGLVHQEYHGTEYAKKGGPFEMVQLWVNLPRKDKMTKPRYQGISTTDIPVVKLANDMGHVRVIAGQYQDAKGPAKTFTPINLWDVRLKAGATLEIIQPAGYTTTVFVLAGEVKTSEGELLRDATLGVFEKEGDRLTITATQDTKMMFLGGEPIDEPIVGYGPFVMNSIGEIKQAFIDFQDGKMGTIGHIEGSEV